MSPPPAARVGAAGRGAEGAGSAPKLPLLRVNFDPALTKLLREVKYLKLLKLEVPAAADAIFDQNETFRQQMGNLDLLTNIYNGILFTLKDVEKPITAIQRFIRKRIADRESLRVAILVQRRWRNKRARRAPVVAATTAQSTAPVVTASAAQLTNDTNIDHGFSPEVEWFRQTSFCNG